MKIYLIHIILNVSRFIVNRLPILLNMLLWITSFLLKHVVRYRSKTIFKNLKNSFYDIKSEQELITIQKLNYDVLIRYLREILYMISWPKDRLMASIYFAQKEYWHSYIKSKKSTIILASHYGNWEMNIVMFPAYVAQRVIAFYKPLSDKSMDETMLKLRAAFGLELFPIEQTVRIMTELKHQNIIYIFIGDQTPLNLHGVYWNTFLQQETPWFNGAEKLAKKYNYPVLYLKQIPHNRHADHQMYTIELQKIIDTPSLVQDDHIIETYSQILENEILNKPEYWLWSHNRWKRAHLKK
ncbi:MAG: lysophospholipid acyltransferase family protein [Saprospiraceae bacterium]|nr:lysophospholipid acyltransferase family protein [Saprospiraceae bacterium]